MNFFQMKLRNTEKRPLKNRHKKILITNGIGLIKALSRDKAVPDNGVDIISERFVTKHK